MLLLERTQCLIFQASGTALTVSCRVLQRLVLFVVARWLRRVIVGRERFIPCADDLLLRVSWFSKMTPHIGGVRLGRFV